LNTSNTAIVQPSNRLMGGSGAGSEASCADIKTKRASAVAGTTNAGQTNTFGTLGILAFTMPIVPCSSPREVKPPTGEPDAGDPHVRFGGGRVRVTGFSHTYRRPLPLRPSWMPDQVRHDGWYLGLLEIGVPVPVSTLYLFMALRGNHPGQA